MEPRYHSQGRILALMPKVHPTHNSEQNPVRQTRGRAELCPADQRQRSVEGGNRWIQNSRRIEPVAEGDVESGGSGHRQQSMLEATELSGHEHVPKP
jgi:hypothetical protein